MLDQVSSRTTTRPSSVAVLALLMAAPFASACGGTMGGDDTASEGAVGVSQDAILGGTAATMTEFGALVKVSSSLGTCSGSLLSDSWVITARHCIPGGHLATPPASPSLTITNLNGVSRTTVEAHYMPGAYVGAPGDPDTRELDVALLRVSTPFPLDFGLNSYPINYLYPFGTDGLDEQEVLCAGFGRRSPGGSSGTANWAALVVDSGSVDSIDFLSDEAGSLIQAPGDSGGPCTKPYGPVRFQFFVTSGGSTGSNGITHVTGPASQTFRDWALGIMKFGVGLYSERNFKGKAQTVANTTVAVERVGVGQISSVRVPPGWQVKLWDTILPGSGNSVTLSADAAVMPTGWDNRAQSVEVLQNGVQIYRDNSFQGSSLMLGPGRHDAAALGSLNNNISSLRIPSDWRVRTYSEPGFTGNSRLFYGSSIGSLGAYNDTISSISVEQAVTVYTTDFYYGDYQILWEGEYGYADLAIEDWSISSIVVPTGYTVIGYENGDLTGASIGLSSSALWMPDGWDNRVRSLRVLRKSDQPR